MKKRKIPFDTPLKVTYRNQKYLGTLHSQTSTFATVEIYEEDDTRKLKNGELVIVLIEDIEILWNTL